MQKNIVVIGAGTMGNGIAHTFAQNNFKVELVDVNIKSLDKDGLDEIENMELATAEYNLWKSNKI